MNFSSAQSRVVEQSHGPLPTTHVSHHVAAAQEPSLSDRKLYLRPIASSPVSGAESFPSSEREWELYLEKQDMTYPNHKSEEKDSRFINFTSKDVTKLKNGGVAKSGHYKTKKQKERCVKKRWENLAHVMGNAIEAMGELKHCLVEESNKDIQAV